ncbi:hypothetical protein BDFG_07734 [Blastomyces dermatitidis ATCC 26199]|nr:hypothetical protein BDFG_07734 [Blastomyces dermatitidis ATCC 26199]
MCESADDLVMLNVKSHTSSSFSTVTVMCLMCNFMIEMKTFSVFNTVNNCMQVCKQLQFYDNH